MIIFDGQKIAKEMLSKLKEDVAKLSFQPVFCDVLIGNDPVAKSYVNIKAKRAEQIGLKFELIHLPENVTNEELLSKLEEIQKNPHLAGLIVQLPLPEQLDKETIIQAIESNFDVDSIKVDSTFAPPTATAVLTILSFLKIDLPQAKILVIGQGELVGRPVTLLLRLQGYQVTTADESTKDLKVLTSDADVIISATGHAKLINSEMIKSGVALIDCGTSESAGSIVGDIDTESISSKAAFIAPVPGGVGPLTVAILLKNVVKVAQSK